MSKRTQQERQESFARASIQRVAERAGLTETTVGKFASGRYQNGTAHGRPLRDIIPSAANDVGVNLESCAL